MIEVHYAVISVGMSLAILFAGYFIYHRRLFALWAKIVALAGAAVVVVSLALSFVGIRYAAQMSVDERVCLAYFRSDIMGLGSGILFVFCVFFFCNRALFNRAMEKKAAAGGS